MESLDGILDDRPNAGASELIPILQQIQAEHKEMNKVRADYLETAKERDEKQKRLAEMTTHIEKLTTLVNDPEISKVKIAWPPKWRFSLISLSTKMSNTHCLTSETESLLASPTKSVSGSASSSSPTAVM